MWKETQSAITELDGDKNDKRSIISIRKDRDGQEATDTSMKYMLQTPTHAQYHHPQDSMVG